jgi:hypothetical protein
MRKLLASGGCQGFYEQICLHFALGKAYLDHDDAARAFHHFDAGNRMKRSELKFDLAQTIGWMASIEDAFPASLFAEAADAGAEDEDAVFIIGMPRSGTSLTEQILASHPAVFGAGEIAFWAAAFVEYCRVDPGTEAGANLTARLRHDYLERLTARSGDSPRVVDKMPANFLYAGLIHQVFPRAKIIHVRRHPVDTCLSIYFQNFSNMGPWVNDLESLAHYFGEYRRISHHWRSVLPPTSLLEIPYEALIEDQETWTRRMLDFVGLPWDPRCLEFHTTDRAVITASKWQVRQKLYAGSVARWKNYQPFLGALRPLLELP